MNNAPLMSPFLLQSSCGLWGTTTGTWSRVWTLAGTLRRLRSVSAGTLSAPWGSTWWPEAGAASPTTGAGPLKGVLGWMRLTTPAWLWSMEVRARKEEKLPVVRLCKRLPSFQIKSWWRPSGSVWFLLRCVPSNCSWLHLSIKFPTSANLYGPISWQHWLVMDRSLSTLKVKYTETRNEFQ